MVSFKDSLDLFVTANVQGGITELQKFAKETDKNLTAAETRIQKYQQTGATMLKVGAAGMGAGGLLTQIASGDEEALASLKASITQVGGQYDDYRDRIENAARSQARFGHTDEDAVKALSSLTLATGDTNKALDLMQVTADYAAKKNISLADAGATIGKIFNGSTKPLKEFGITVGTNADGTKNYTAAVDELGKKLTGQAAASVDSWGGKLKILGAEAENFVSSVGQKFGPAILGVSTLVTASGGIMSGASTIVGKLTASHEAAALAAKDQAISEALAAGATEEEAAAAGEATVANEGLMASLGPIAVAAAAVGIALAALSHKGEQVSVDVHKFASGTNEQLLSVYNTAKTAFGGSELPDFINKLKDGGAEGVGALVRLRDAVKATGGDTKDLDAAIAGAASSQEQLTSTTEAGNTALGNTSGLTSQKDAADALANALQAAKDKLQNLSDLASGAPGSDLSAQRAALAVGDAKQQEADATSALNDARKTGDPAKIAQAERDLAKAQIGTKQSVLDAADANAKWVESQDALNGKLDDSKDKANLSKDSLVFFAQTLGDHAGDMQPYIDDLQKVVDLQDRLGTLNGPDQIEKTYSSGGVQRRASGGSYQPGWLLAGEGGKPELIHMGSGGTVYDGDKTEKMFAGGGGMTVHIGSIVEARNPYRTYAEVAHGLRAAQYLMKAR